MLTRNQAAFFATAQLQDIRPHFDPQHDVDRSKVEAIIEAVTAGRDEYGDRIINWTMPPVVVIEDEGNGYLVLDGHHRLTAARKLEIREIPAWVVSVSDYCRLLEERFDGCSPLRLADLRDCIMCGDVDANEVAPADHE